MAQTHKLPAWTSNTNFPNASLCHTFLVCQNLNYFVFLKLTAVLKFNPIFSDIAYTVDFLSRSVNKGKEEIQPQALPDPTHACLSITSSNIYSIVRTMTIYFVLLLFCVFVFYTVMLNCSILVTNELHHCYLLFMP